MWYVIVFVGGYVASMYTWPAIRTKLMGAENEIMSLRQRVKDLEARIRGL